MPMPLPPPSCHRRSLWRITVPLAFYYFLLSSQVEVQGLQPPSPSSSPQRIGSTLAAAAAASTTTALPDVVSIQVCRNKNCCKNSPYLLQSMANLLGSDRVEETGCLAQCEKGPNVQVQFSISSSSSSSSRASSSSPLLILHEMLDATTAAIQLESATIAFATTTATATATTTTLPHEAEQRLPKLVKAAAKVLERVMSGTSSNHIMTPQPLDAAERERLTTSVISKLVVEYPDCTALAHAYALRAKARQELENWEGAIDDAQQVIVGKLLRQQATASSVSICYRVWADSEEGLHHRDKAVAVLEDWQKAQPCFRTKIQREVQDLLLQTP